MENVSPDSPFYPSPEPEIKVTKETNKVVEKIGKNNLRRLAALGIAAAGILGISGKLESGGGISVEAMNPVTGQTVDFGIVLSSSEKRTSSGETALLRGAKELQRDIKGFSNLDTPVYLRVGGLTLGVYSGATDWKAYSEFYKSHSPKDPNIIDEQIKDKPLIIIEANIDTPLNPHYAGPQVAIPNPTPKG